MPTVAVEKEALFERLGKEYSDEEFDELCFEFGVELDEVTSERDEAVKNRTLSPSELEALSSTVVYKIDVPANRYDLLCLEGLSRALLVFLGKQEAPRYRVLHRPDDEDMTVVTVTADTASIRPFIVCAVLRGVAFTPRRYASFLDLQDQLHRNLCRQRTLVAIGTHDLDAVAAPFTYDARSGSAIHFVPLTHAPSDQSFRADRLIQLYDTDATFKHLKQYLPIIQHSPLYPVLVDANDTVLSLPPIINGSASKITLHTTNVFIECTATDLTKANIVLDTIVSMFSEYASTPFTVEPVLINFTDHSHQHTTNSYITPIMSTRTECASVDFVNSLIGIDISPDRMVELCNKMQLGPASLLLPATDPHHDDGDDYNHRAGVMLQVTVPPTRSDILHPVDIAEDIGIAYGYNNIVKRVPKTSTVGGEQLLNKVSDLLREEIGRAGYVEILTHGLCSLHDNFTALGRPIPTTTSGDEVVRLSNPANVEYQVVRTTLLPGLLKTLQHNKSASFTCGFKLFEISDVVLPDGCHTICESIVGAKNVRRLCAVYSGPTSGFEIVHGLVDRVMTLLEVCPEREYVQSSAREEEEKFRICRDGWYYTIQELDQTNRKDTVTDDDEDGEKMEILTGTYFPGRAAEILLTKPGEPQKCRVGTFGILHPIVLEHFDIRYPSSCLEMDLSPLLS